MAFQKSIKKYNTIYNKLDKDSVINFLSSVSGIVVSIAAFQAVDPGSIPGRRNLFFDFSPRKISHLATIANFLSYCLGSAVGSASVS